MNRDLFLAILSMDSYNRGYGQNVLLKTGDSTTGQSEAGRNLGNAKILSFQIPLASAASGFYAIAYNWNGETVISYRGTNFDVANGGAELLKDIFDGWTLGAGYPAASQANLAVDFCH